MEKIAVIVAGGSGTRMGSEIPKQLLEINNKPILIYTIEAFVSAFDDMKIILVLPAAYLENGKQLMQNFFPNKSIECISGGATRFDSVKAGLSLINSSSIVFVHDAVRCLVSVNLIKLAYQTALKEGSAIPVVPIKDSIRMINGNSSQIINRDVLRAVQTPQTFKSEILLPAFNQPFDSSFTDEASVVEKLGHSVALFPGEDLNIKITVPADLEFARIVVSSK
jgi:2-C-methyl-D-erythritol 4-phosphate cytidylyltransferase